MNFIIAKLTGNNNEYRKVVSGETYYNNFDIEESVEYSPYTVLEEGQWYRIDNFSEQDFCLDLLINVWDSTEYELLSSIDIKKLVYICAYQSGNQYFFQRTYTSSVLSNKCFIHLGDDIKFEKDKNIIVLKTEPDALYLKDVNRLYFKKLETIAPIFKGIDQLYLEATTQDVRDFFEKPFIRASGDFAPDKVGKANRNRLALVMKKMNELDEEQLIEVFEYTNSYYPNLSYNGRFFLINSNEDFKNLMYGMEERLFTTPVTNKKFAANSVIKL